MGARRGMSEADTSDATPPSNGAALPSVSGDAGRLPADPAPVFPGNFMSKTALSRILCALLAVILAGTTQLIAYLVADEEVQPHAEILLVAIFPSMVAVYLTIMRLLKILS